MSPRRSSHEVAEAIRVWEQYKADLRKRDPIVWLLTTKSRRACRRAMQRSLAAVIDAEYAEAQLAEFLVG